MFDGPPLQEITPSKKPQPAKKQDSLEGKPFNEVYGSRLSGSMTCNVD